MGHEGPEDTSPVELEGEFQELVGKVRQKAGERLGARRLETLARQAERLLDESWRTRRRNRVHLRHRGYDHRQRQRGTQTGRFTWCNGILSYVTSAQEADFAMTFSGSPTSSAKRVL